MKTQRAVLPLAFLSAAFMLACKDSTTNPLTPDGTPVQFAKGGRGSGGDNPGSPFYRYTFAPDPGDITTDPSPAVAKPTVGANQGDEVVLQHCCDNPRGDELLKLSSAFLGNLVGASADACFKDILAGVKFVGSLRRDKKVENKVVAVFYFNARDENGTPDVDVRYLLRLDGGDDENVTGEGIFPPEVDGEMTVTFTHASIGAARKKEKNACSGARDALPGGDTSVELKGII